MAEKTEEKTIGIFNGTAKIGEILAGFSQLTLTPQDLTSPVALQMAISRIYEAMTKAVASGPKKKYVAEVRFTDSLGNPVVLALDLGERMPPFTNKEVRARILIELFEDTQ
ncbi:MAG: hypothetical protein NO515_00995 [Candidatus Methanomethylicia archaeon]|jgi:hypothetical protein|nr:hypothetical protein [Candidatus Methanomethylicia archaeon]MCQ5373590.1 hypothetical protein [Candidatus Methanomethylicia archaeon]NHV61255.1 hypothetical protein [Candidatus Verstraetearchaeota archaeon]